MTVTPPSPITNPDLMGHEAAERAFLDAWTSGRLAHAWLITGPRGIGKATFAYRIARFVLAGGGAAGGLFADGAQDLAIAPAHPVFHRIAAGGHADLKVIERGYSDEKTRKRRGEIVVEDVRSVGGFLSLTPAEGGWRVVIVDAACEMNRSAANALLKVLEEPPKHALLLLLAHAPGRLLPTIRSRCRLMPLRPLALDQVDRLLTQAHPQIGPDDRAVLAALSEGSIGRALALAEQGGLDLYRDLVGLIAALPRLDVAALHAFADRLARAGAEEAYRTVTELLRWWLARLVRAGGVGRLPPELVAGEAEAMQRLLAAGAIDQWVETWEKTAQLFARADGLKLDRKQVMLDAILSIQRAVAA